MLARLKQAAMVLAGYRPAEVQFDELHSGVARDIASMLAEDFIEAGDHSKEALRGVIELAIHKNAGWCGSPLWFRWRPWFKWRDRNPEIPF